MKVKGGASTKLGYALHFHVHQLNLEVSCLMLVVLVLLSCLIIVLGRLNETIALS